MRALALLSGTLVVLYPLAVYIGLDAIGLPALALGLAVLFLARSLLLPRRLQALVPVERAAALIGAALCMLAYAWQDTQWLRFYPVVVNGGLLAVFGWSLYRPPTVIERLARLSEPELPEQAVRYTRIATQVWCFFFVINGAIALVTAVWGSLEQWALYNGLISYLLIGALLAGEWGVRQWYRARSSA